MIQHIPFKPFLPGLSTHGDIHLHDKEPFFELVTGNKGTLLYSDYAPFVAIITHWENFLKVKSVSPKHIQDTFIPISRRNLREELGNKQFEHDAFLIVSKESLKNEMKWSRCITYKCHLHFHTAPSQL